MIKRDDLRTICDNLFYISLDATLPAHLKADIRAQRDRLNVLLMRDASRKRTGIKPVVPVDARHARY